MLLLHFPPLGFTSLGALALLWLTLPTARFDHPAPFLARELCFFAESVAAIA